MAVGDSNDILSRVKSALPRRWFAWTAPYRDAIIGGLSDSGAWCYSWITYARQQSRIRTAVGPWLDIISWDYLSYHYPRNGMNDDTFREVIIDAILQERVTRRGMIDALTKLTGSPPKLFEPWNTFDTGALDEPSSILYLDVSGGCGEMNLPAQVFIKTTTGRPPLTPFIAGLDTYAGGCDAGLMYMIDASQEAGPVEDAQIYDIINITKATGSICWVAIDPPTTVTQSTVKALQNQVQSGYGLTLFDLSDFRNLLGL